MTDTPSAPNPVDPETPAKTKNTLGVIALVTAIVGAVFACVPGALIIGWILLPIAFILGLVALFQKGRRRAAIAAVIISIVGTVVGVVVFLAVVADAFDDAFNEEPTVKTSDKGSDDSAADGSEKKGTRENPYPLGSEISSEDWTVTVNSVDLDGTQAVMAENPFNESPAEGHVYILVNLTATYTGDDPEGDTPWTQVAYVSSEGKSFEVYDNLVVAPDQFDELTTLYEGASTSGNLVIEAPAEALADGVLAVTPGLIGGKVFVAVA